MSRKKSCLVMKLFIVTIWASSVILTSCTGSSSPTQVPAASPTITATIEAPTQTPTPPSVIPVPIDSKLVSLFDYDPGTSLNVTWERKEQKDSVVRDWVKFLSVKGCESEAILVHPIGEGQYPAVIYMHMGQGSKNQFVDEAVTLAEKGVISLLLDSPFVSHCFGPSSSRAGFIASVVEVRRGLDLLDTLPAVDPDRIGFVGHSFGATWGGVVAGIEPRLAAYVLMGGYAQFSTSGAVDYSDLDAILYIGHNTTAPVLFQFSTHDEYISQEQAKMYYKAARSPKKIVWYDTNHVGLQKEGQIDRLTWLGEQLGFVYP
jgi:fermentation-respiration switch protein FrsA (DUF1100 family)